MSTFQVSIGVLTTQRSRTALLAATLFVAAPARGQVTCRLTRDADSVFVGACTRGRDTAEHVRLHLPTAKEPHLWRGTGSMHSRPKNIVPVALDTSNPPVYRSTFFWLIPSAIHVAAASLEFSYRSTDLVPPTDIDLRILRRARRYFDDASRWNSAADPDPSVAVPEFVRNPALLNGGYCPNTAKRTLFCNLYEASIAEAGEFSWLRPAMAAVRAGITAESPSSLQHPLMQFNGAPTTTLADVQRVLDEAIAYVLEQQSCQVQFWVWGSAKTTTCR